MGEEKSFQVWEQDNDGELKNLFEGLENPHYQNQKIKLGWKKSFIFANIYLFINKNILKIFFNH